MIFALTKMILINVEKDFVAVLQQDLMKMVMNLERCMYAMMKMQTLGWIMKIGLLFILSNVMNKEVF